MAMTLLPGIVFFFQRQIVYNLRGTEFHILDWRHQKKTVTCTYGTTEATIFYIIDIVKIITSTPRREAVIFSMARPDFYESHYQAYQDESRSSIISQAKHIPKD